MWKSLKKSLNSPDSYVSLALGLAVVLVVGMIAFNYFKAKIQNTAQQKAEDQKEQAQESLTLPAKYTVKAGDTLWSISEKYYKSGYNWVDVQNTNKLTSPDSIEEGKELTIPDVKPGTVTVGEVSSAFTDKKADIKEYTVVRGDSLWTIAEKSYGSGYKWTDIANANHLTNPDIIHAGNVLLLP
jgi:nucleoid-associated protein YgaU